MQDYERKHLRTLRRSLAECTVLLKKDGSFPLEGPCSLALYGSGARHTVKGGTGSGEVNSRFFITAERGLEKTGFNITTEKWLDAYDRVREKAGKDFLKEIRARARKNHTLAILEGMGAVMPEPDYDIPLEGEGDAAVYVLSRISGEGNDRQAVKGDILLTDTEVRDILALNEKFDRFMLVLNVGGPVDLTPVLSVKNILLLSQLGVETGRILAEILIGKRYPSGKLTTTWAAWEDYPQIGDFGDPDNTRYREGVYVGYRYFDTVGKKPLFPFGFGLSYTDFETEVLKAGEDYVQIRVKNTGAFPGKETLQIYAAPPAEGLDKPVRSLIAFHKSGEIGPGEEKTIGIHYSLKEAASYDEEASAWILDQGDYQIMLGDKTFLTLRLGEKVTVRSCRKAFGKPDFTDWVPEKRQKAEGCGRILAAYAGNLADAESYKAPKQEIFPEIKALENEALAALSVGYYSPGGGIAGVIGSAAATVAGAAGETSRTFPGGKGLVMADGPAGLRLAKDYFRDKEGARSLGSSMPETMAGLLPAPVRLLMSLTAPRPGKGTTVLHQYCTAIPIGTAIAQSWNTDFASACGDIVGEEMERFGIQLWLAPGMNIHRSIRCGRNFEYFSEDPLVTGSFAAAIARGVQSHPGCGVTIKHFAANSQETNRYNSNSMVSERALREIYLKGFEIAVKQASPLALMTSYNLLNGTHTSERKDLTEDVLRGEWGFKGIVMTDWVVGGSFNKNAAYPAPEAWKVAAAGGDLFMPGSKGDQDNVLKALEEGRLDRSVIEKNASRVLAMIRKLNG